MTFEFDIHVVDNFVFTSSKWLEIGDRFAI